MQKMFFKNLCCVLSNQYAVFEKDMFNSGGLIYLIINTAVRINIG